MTVANAHYPVLRFLSPKNSNPMSLLPMGNRIQEIRECYQQAADCVQQAEASHVVIASKPRPQTLLLVPGQTAVHFFDPN
jgi:hypothetical protein